MSMNRKSDGPPPSLVDALWEPLLAFEADQLNQEQIVRWFTLMVQTGYIWKMPTYYLINASRLIEGGAIGDKYREVN